MSNGVDAWSYSRYADYKQCPLRFKLKHIDKKKEPGSPAMQRGSDIHKEGENYLKAKKRPRAVPKSYANFKDEMTQLWGLNPLVEQQWGFTRQWSPTGWFGSDTWLRIVADVAVAYDDNTGDLIDFKTGRKYDTNEEQVELFSAGMFIKFPEMQHVTTRLWYLDVDPKDDNEVIREYTRADFENIRKDWERKIIPMFKDKKFAPTPNAKCRWCAFSKDKGGPCPFNGG